MTIILSCLQSMRFLKYFIKSDISIKWNSFSFPVSRTFILKTYWKLIFPKFEEFFGLRFGLETIFLDFSLVQVFVDGTSRTGNFESSTNPKSKNLRIR